MKSGSPSRTTAAHKTQTKIPGLVLSRLPLLSLLLLFLPKLLRGTRDRWVAQVSFIIIYSTGLAPLVTYPHRPSQAEGYPSSTQEHGSESSVPPVLLLLQHHRFGQPLAVSASSCCPISSAPRSPSAARALWQRVPPPSRVSAPM